METATITTEKGNINISQTTLETLIRLALQNINGIIQPKKVAFPRIIQTSDAGGADKNRISKSNSPDVRIEIKPDSILVNLFLIINYGIRIPDLTWEVQAKVKEKIKEVTDLDIDQINVHIQGIYFSKRYNSKKKLVSQGSFLKIF